MTNSLDKPLDAQSLALLRAYVECSDEVREVVGEMVRIVSDENTDREDREMALLTIKDALFPFVINDQNGMNLEEADAMAVSVSEEAKNAIADLDREEEEFATRLQKLMIEKGVTQQQLAEKLKVGQPAISNMLNRQCRPQRRTIYRIAGALGVNPEELWPNIE